MANNQNYIRNPLTNRRVKVGGSTYLRLVADGVIETGGSPKRKGSPKRASSTKRAPSIVEGPPIMKDEFKIWDYQETICKWMDKQELRRPVDGVVGGMLILTMGLGKTLIALHHIFTARRERYEQYPSLVVMSKTLLSEWETKGINKFFTGVNALYYHKDIIGKNAFESLTTKDFKKYDIVLVTYDTLLSTCRAYKYEKTVCEYGESGIHAGKVIKIHHRSRPLPREHTGPKNLYEIPWERMICDESQKFSNAKTYTFKAVMAVYSRYRWCLTGTPIRNYSVDIWTQLRFCGFDRIEHARKWKHHMFEHFDCAQHMKIMDYDDAKVEMPEKIEQTYYVDMDVNQTAIYRTILTKLCNIFSDFLMGADISYSHILALFTRLRQIVIAPCLISKSGDSKVSKIIDSAIEKREDLREWISNPLGTAGIYSPKIAKVTQIVHNYPTEKVIIFSMFTTSLKLCQLALKKIGVSCDLLIGSTSMTERSKILRDFSTGGTQVLLVHYKVGGEGLTLTEATHVIPLEPWWTHAVHNQGIFRAWRRGQTKVVKVHWVISPDTVEKYILALCDSKQNLSDSYLKGVEYDPESVKMDIMMMKKLLGFVQ